MTVMQKSFGPLTNGVSSLRPKLVVAAVLIASMVVGLDTRVFAVGLPDVQAAYGLGVDEASWLTTIANAPQLLIASAVAFLVTVFGIRRVMIPSCLLYACVSIAIPLVDGKEAVFTLHALRALLLGVFVPATMMIIFRNLPTRAWVIGIAIYCLRVPLAQSLGFVLVGVYGDLLGWQWMYWQDGIIAPVIALLLVFAAPREPINLPLLEHADWGGMLLLGSAMTLIYAALDQGNRLDWFQSGLILALLSGGTLLFVGFLINESVVRHPWAHASVILSRNIGLGYAIIMAFSLSSAGIALNTTGFLQSVAGLRPIFISQLYLVGAVVPVGIFMVLAIAFLRRADARLGMILGLVLMAAGAAIDARLTLLWSPWNFLPGVLLQTAGQCFAFLSTVLYLVGNSDPKRSTAVSAYIQVVRLGSVEMGSSLMGTLLRKREQMHSLRLSEWITHSSDGLASTQHRLATIIGTGPHAVAESLATIASHMRAQAYVLAYADLATIAFWSALAGVLLVGLLGRMPHGPLHPAYVHAPSA